MSPTRRHFALGLGLVGATASLAPAVWADPVDDDDAPVNVFISPCGQPFRAPRRAPYAVVDWFKQADKNQDGKLDRTEFKAAAEAFFKVLDRNHDGVLGPYEVEIYERVIAPEVLGFRYRPPASAANRPRPVGHDGGLLWQAQMGGMGGGMGGVPTTVDPSGGSDIQDPKPPRFKDESGTGAAPYGLLSQPEPVTAADLNFDSIITKANFLRLADMHFDALDPDRVGYLTLARLPKTDVQLLLERWRKKHA